MFIQINNDKIVAYSDSFFAGCTREIPEVNYAEYCAEPFKYVLDGGTLVLNPEYEIILAEKTKQEEINSIKLELEDLDFKSIRAIRAGEIEYISEYERQAETLRVRLTELGE